MKAETQILRILSAVRAGEMTVMEAFDQIDSIFKELLDEESDSWDNPLSR